VDKDKIKVEYDQDSDILYIRIGNRPVVDTDEIAEDLFFEYDKEGNVVGIEIWRANELVIKTIADKIGKRIRTVIS